MKRNELILKMLQLSNTFYIGNMALVCQCPEASTRRSIQELRADGYYIILDDKIIRYHGKRQALLPEQQPEHIAELTADDPIETLNVGGDADADYQR